MKVIVEIVRAEERPKVWVRHAFYDPKEVARQIVANGIIAGSKLVMSGNGVMAVGGEGSVMVEFKTEEMEP